MPTFVIVAASLGLSAYLEDRFKWHYMLAFAVAMAFMLAIAFPFYRWAYPIMKCAPLQASHRALRTGTTLLAIAMLVLATGAVWGYVNPRVPLPAPPEFEVPAPAVLDAHLAMLRYKTATLDCSIARIDIRRDVIIQPECAIVPEAPRKGRNKSEAWLREQARRERCQRLMADLELATACRRPDVAEHATKLSAKMHAESATRQEP